MRRNVSSCASFFLFAVLICGFGYFISKTRAAAPPQQARHGLNGNYYLSTLETHTDVLTEDVKQSFYVQVWFDPNDFQLPKPLGEPATVRVDPQVAFGKGKGFAKGGSGRKADWAPMGYKAPAGWKAPSGQPWDYLAAVIWKGYIHLPKAGTYYFSTISNGPSAVYLRDARVALNGGYGGAFASGTFSYSDGDVQDYVNNISQGQKDTALAARPGDTYVVPVTIDSARDLPIEVRYQTWVKSNPGIDLFWVTPDSPRDSSGKPVAQIVPGDALYADAPGKIEQSQVRSANSTISADFLYFPVEHADKDVTVTVRLADKDGNPVAGKRVYISSVVSYGNSGDAITQPQNPTDKDGITTAKIRAGGNYKVPHDSAIFATDVTDLVDAAQVAHLTFQSVPDSLFPDNFSPYYGQALVVEPEAMVVGKPVTISTTLENRSKYPADVTATFKATDWNIGAAVWPKIGEVGGIRLKPGEVRKVSITWTPKQAQTHQCFSVELNGKYVTINHSDRKIFAAALLPAMPVLAAPQADNLSGGISSRIQRNFGPLVPDSSPCENLPFDTTLDPPLLPNPGETWQSARVRISQLYKTKSDQLSKEAADAAAAGDTRRAADLSHEALNYQYMADCIKSFAPVVPVVPTKTQAKSQLPQAQASADRDRNEWWWHCVWQDPNYDQALCDALYQAYREASDVADGLRKLAHDPPEPSYRRLAVAASDTSLGFIDAVRSSLERYQGAQAQGDQEWMARHATAVRLYQERLRDSLRRNAEQLRKRAESQPPAQNPDEFEKRWTETMRGKQITADQHRKVLATGFTQAQVDDMAQQFRSVTQPPKPLGKSLFIDAASDDDNAASQWQQVSEIEANNENAGANSARFSQAITVGNPHDKEERLDLFIRPISTPPDWKLTIVNAETQPNAQDAKSAKAPQFPIHEDDAGKRYSVTLPAKAQLKVASVVLPVGELGAHTTARWAVEGKIGDELIGGMVHEMNVPYIIPDLKLPPIGSQETEDVGTSAASRTRLYLAAALAAIIIAGGLWFLLFWRRGRSDSGTPAAS